ncbi:MAG: flagellin-like hook-associated protein FlgL [Motiliproteus sp.]|jgi:flagellin-like hook-associated protein FlgL
MSLVINTNIASQNAQLRLLQSGRDLDTAMERLSSGKRINSAADDAAGLTMSSRMTAQIKGLDQAVRNANDGISMMQVAEGALGESTNILQRMRELSIQSGNGIFTDGDRGTLDAEFQQLATELDRIATTTQFNGRTLLDGSESQIVLQIGAEANQAVAFSIPATTTATLGLSAQGGDLVGAEMEINSSGGLSNALGFAAVKINGESLSGLSAGASVGELLANINTRIEGVSAATLTQVQALAVGDGVLQGDDTLIINALGLDGSLQSYSIGNTDSLEALAAAINTKAGNRISASVDDDGQLRLSSDSAARISVQDSTQGAASGMNIGASPDPDTATVLQGLASFWMSEAETLIQSEYGLTLSNFDITLKLVDEAPFGKVAQVSFAQAGGVLVTGSLELEIDMADYKSLTLPDGTGTIQLDRVITHELVHAAMATFTDMTDPAGNRLRADGKDSLPGWFTEGAAELIHGADDRVDNERTYIDTQGEFEAVFDATLDNGSPSVNGGYSVAYAATKLLHEELLAGGTSMGRGIEHVFDALEAGNSLDEAITAAVTATGAGNFSNRGSFETYFRDVAGLAFITGLAMTDGDTGSMGGSDYGGPALDASAVLPNNPVGASTAFNLIIPDQYSGGFMVASARLVLTADDGGDITLTKAAQGTDDSMQSLGFRQIRAAGDVVGQGLDATAQGTAIDSGDLSINGVVIARVAASAGLAAKIDAINAVSDETGVVARMTASGSFSPVADPGTALTSAGAVSIGVGQDGYLVLNGIGVAVAVGHTAADISASINNIAGLGVTAYSDDAGRLQLFSQTVINIGVTDPDTVTAMGGGFNAATDDGSILLNGTEVLLSTLSDSRIMIDELNAQSGSTGVRAGIDGNGKLELRASSAIRISLGNSNGLQALSALGIDFGVAGDEDLTDTNADNRLGDETFTLNARIQLESFNDQSISIAVTENGATATGLSDLNSGNGGRQGSSVGSLDITTAVNAQKSVTSLGSALETVSEVRSQLGAITNRLDFSVNNLVNISQNTSAARSRIVDADFAQESAMLSRTQVLQRAAQAMLAQANSAPRQVLALLR